MNKELNHEEDCYRRGYSQGFFNARHPENKHLTYQDVLEWRNDPSQDHPPGSPFRKDKNEIDEAFSQIDEAFSQFSPS